jgi:hypothetical protein
LQNSPRNTFPVAAQSTPSFHKFVFLLLPVPALDSNVSFVLGYKTTMIRGIHQPDNQGKGK